MAFMSLLEAIVNESREGCILSEESESDENR